MDPGDQPEPTLPPAEQVSPFTVPLGPRGRRELTMPVPL